ncbi:hypothetical protein [Candidatus Halobonum tyrrellensis]|uniref:AlkP-core domain protein n=1 Tax=Candidatus Halobonum tyrrellensis G22 TaxID=1324957 RepID=V4J3Q5_9EURY|nr:hypothetical protein [Candidatus Halobonum tyrrellensis]ESP90012.1 hypothetical protein K933_00577 [Candidatus Halobonum tyrrellensis G22]
MEINEERLRLGLSNPNLLARKLSQTYNRLRSQGGYNPNGIDFLEQDWDNLLILDACRYDLFEELNDIPGDLRRVESRGSATPEFLRGNFDGKQLLDTVYVTTNPMLYRHRDALDVEFHAVVDLWRGETWDDEHETVLPEVVTAEAKRVADDYPDKRLVVHYMQPHYPFIEAETTFDKGHIGDDSPDGLTTWMQVLTGEIDIDEETLWNAYADNLRRALPHVKELTEYLTGKTVVTSDHGNMFGERASPLPIREWGHPPGIWTDELVEVPWLELTNGDRRAVVSEPPDELSSEDDESVQDRLESLGYV